ncbi:MAG: hypothetical protein ACLFTG_08965 [Alphaproteobacteria bacterium]
MPNTTIGAGRAPLLALATAAAVAALTATAPAVEAAFVIDDFQTADSVISPATGDTPSESTRSTEPQGFNRTMNVSEPVAGEVTNEIRPDVGWILRSPDSAAIGRLFYDTTTTDLSSFPFLKVDVEKAQASTPTSFSLSAGLIDSNGKSDFISESFEAGETGAILFALADFDVDTTKIDEISFRIFQTNFGSETVVGQVAAVPIPGALPLFLGGLAGVGYVVRRRQRQAAAA